MIRELKMPPKELKNKPLVEAVLEVKWALKAHLQPGIEIDPHYRLLLGRFSERIEKEYPYHEPLPSSQIPDGMVAHSVQHRFRVGNGKWPLIQIGPGILTINETSSYTWQDYGERCKKVMSHLYDAYPAKTDLSFTDLSLRYIDAMDFDYNVNNLLSFLSEKLKTKIELPSSLFQGTGVKEYPIGLNWQISFKQEKPGGIVSIRFATGQKDKSPSIIWETLVQTAGQHLPKIPDGFPQWLDDAHAITDDWFFKLIEGDLERRFLGE
jgi:uncharacterized protein (TIGR04255 family)